MSSHFTCETQNKMTRQKIQVLGGAISNQQAVTTHQTTPRGLFSADLHLVPCQPSSYPPS